MGNIVAIILGLCLPVAIVLGLMIHYIHKIVSKEIESYNKSQTPNDEHKNGKEE